MRLFPFPLLRSWFPGSSESAADLIARLLGLPEHRWILDDRVLRVRIPAFLAFLPQKDLALLLAEKQLLFLYSNAKMSCSFYQFRGREIVLLFPDLRRLLASAAYYEGYAILAHEIGHIVLGHTQRALDPTQAQLEADRYAVDLGFAEELFSALQFETPTTELVERLTRLQQNT